MGGLGFTFADVGGDNTSFLAEVLRDAGAEERTVPEAGDARALSACDVVLDHGQLDFGLLRSLNEGIILASVTGFGLSGPCKDWKADSYVAAAAGGSMHMCGKEDGEPLAPAGAQAEKIAGLFAANGVMLALLERTETGKGKHLDVSMQEAVAGALDLVLVRHFYYGENPHRTGSVAWGKQNFIIPCEDGHIMVHIRQSSWQTIVDWMAGDGAAQDLGEPRWADEGYRHENLSHVIDVMSAWGRQHTKEELFETAQLMRMAWAKVEDGRKDVRHETA